MGLSCSRFDPLKLKKNKPTEPQANGVRQSDIVPQAEPQLNARVAVIMPYYDPTVGFVSFEERKSSTSSTRKRSNVSSLCDGTTVKETADDDSNFDTAEPCHKEMETNVEIGHKEIQFDVKHVKTEEQDVQMETNSEEKALTKMEMSGINQKDMNVTVTFEANSQELSDYISDQTNPSAMLSFHHIPGDETPNSANNNTESVEQESEPAGQFHLSNTNSPAVIFASDKGISLARSLWQQMADANQLGHITLIYNIPSPQAIQFSKELTDLNVRGIISDLIFVYGEPEEAVWQISNNSRTVKLIKEKTEDGGHIFVAGSSQFNMGIRHLVAKATMIPSENMLLQEWYHSLIVSIFNM